ncbi:MAG: 50S ribosomal protein L22 [Candidatus Yanofskybacteria bacterium GW2011_GWA1_44_21]|uniref:Large ribosomal subunit protein uL22 n=2 Tax=Candidatus Yanofskyibacteriota TaxID=1752733 RepID=A0A1F8H146_9BACT|nr:MAG: 50S ribosomal protein L22 [Candidatus Yanofskybacteria bacterium GW2011_GWA2_44_10]KKT50693.1 MAG: 50S ribosomal protein L22 [Candidatus Yanofskybacteria bacterium GW2011_GWA1_44_21]KKT90221.1 MAG: 50S ribosomal protein L22 [Candidatus Yanofskybacteria bacterium GW2011_GWB1_45_11]OGN02217.1 MAG: 50S ribosomal protein L22 [Candidatus Yanofskybacteria bacterium RIFCSPHIGHO2_01_FULL_44_110b]OGN14843.1 MAG: 50S ribosomal protein L22 [Candidatus Yanofskybacteria bacterium RIFCSPHIGHO2_02_FUL
MQTVTKLNNLRLAPRKVRSVANLLKGKDVLAALDQLEFFVKRPSPHMIKLLKSALANAENNFHMVKENLYIKSILVNEGVKLRRFEPKGFGRVSPIQKKTSLITVVLDEKVAGLKRTVKSKPEHVHEHKVETEAKTDKKPEIKTEIGKKVSKKGFVKRIFQRKTV